MNLKKLTTLLFAGVTAATPFATNAQNPTILQGNYVSNVFGQANFVLNPNAQTNVANVTLTNATATRSTTTPLVATSEWNVTVTSANGTAAWATRSFDAGMKNQNCEARFSYRGFQATSKAQIKQGANVVAELTLTPSATDPRIASINFPCGDLSIATKFLVTDTATLSGTNEIGGIYVGLATNQANVAQAEVVVRASKSTVQTVPAGANTKITYQSEQLDTNNYWDTSTSTFTATKPGCYKFEATISSTLQSWQTGSEHYLFIIVNGDLNTRINGDRKFVTNTGTIYAGNKVVASSCFNVGETAEVYYYHNRTTNADVDSNVWYTRLTITRFPSSSELVVTPETQNVWGGVKMTAGGQLTNVTSSSWTKMTSPSTVTRTTFGKAKVETNNDMSITVDDLPVGSYQVSVTGSFYAASATSGITQGACNFGIADSPTGGAQIASMRAIAQQEVTSSGGVYVAVGTMQGVYVNSSVGNRTFYVQAKLTTASGLCSANLLNADYPVTITITPIDNASNSALYVQGPVKGSGTGAAIPAGYVGEGINTVTSSFTGVSNGSWKTGTGITLQPGIYFIRASANFGNIAPTDFSVGITTTVNGSGIADSLGYGTARSVKNAGNTCCGMSAFTDGYFRVTTPTVYYPTGVVFTPTSSSYALSLAINAFRIN